MEKIPGLYPLVKTDQNGKKCSGEFLLPACVGYCKTSETGTHEFPYSKQESKVCALIGDELENVTLSNCDPDADMSIRWVLIPKSKTCGCKNLTLLKTKGL
uniref:Cys_knot domain-containing protein n=1 Tax=Acrobeloides nanus TaxID=290746 RepID=A0A914E5Z7_9BILA